MLVSPATLTIGFLHLLLENCVFGVMIGQIAKAYGLDVEDDLAQIIPE